MINKYYLYDLPLSLTKTLVPLTHNDGEIQTSDPRPEDLASELQNVDLSASEGSDTSSSSSGADEGQETHLNTISEYQEECQPDQSHLTGSPYVLYTSNNAELVPADKCLAVYKVMLNPDLIAGEPVQAVQNTNKEGHSVILMIGGGHFAGAIIAHKRPKNGVPNVLQSKSFHRYTTRRKQGGSQSTSDSGKGKAKSAGASLRRYNEAALESEVREQLQAWSSLIKTADNLFIRATGRQNRAILMNYDKSPVVSSDRRIRPIPFTTKRATSMEVRRVWHGLTSANIVNRPKPQSPKKPTKEKAARPQNTTNNRPERVSPPPQSPEELDTEEIVSLIKKNSAHRVIAYYRQRGIDPNFALEPKSRFRNQPNALFYATSCGQHHLVQMLLVTLQCDPTIENDTGAVAAQLVPEDSPTGYAFRVARMTLGEDRWNWNAAGVGSPISREEVDKIAEKKQEKERLDRKKEQERLLNEKSPTNNSVRTQKLSSVATKLGQEAQLRDMSPEMRARLERERRARAAEARFRNA